MHLWEFTFELVPRQKDKPLLIEVFNQLDTSSGRPIPSKDQIMSDKFQQKIPYISQLTQHEAQLAPLLDLDSGCRRLHEFFQAGFNVAKKGSFDQHLVVVGGPGVTTPFYFDSPFLFLLCYFLSLDLRETNYKFKYNFIQYQVYEERKSIAGYLTRQLRQSTLLKTETGKKLLAMIEGRALNAAEYQIKTFGNHPPTNHFLFSIEQHDGSNIIDLMELQESYANLIQEYPKEIGFYLDHARICLSLAKTKKTSGKRLALIANAEESIEVAKVLDSNIDWSRVYHYENAIDEWKANPMMEWKPVVITPDVTDIPKISDDVSAVRITESKTFKTFNGYDIALDSKIGTGASGDVFRGTWKSEQVAIKKMDTANWNTARSTEFIAEAHFMMSIKSDYVVKAYDLVASQPNFLLIMPYMHCGDLMNLLDKKALTYPERIVIAKDIAHGLSDLHNQGIIHRDIKSLNVLVNDKKRAKIADMGHAKTELKLNVSMYQSTRSVSGSYGTVEWKAPEIINDPRLVSAQSDVYALGMTLWEIGTARKPFESLRRKISRDELEQQIARGVREDLSSIERENPGLAHIIKRCWDVRSTRATASEVLQGLATVKSEIGNPLVGPNSSMPSDKYVSTLQRPNFLSKPN